MGSAAPLVQPVAPGQTVPGAAPSAKFTKANDPPPPEMAAGVNSRGETGPSLRSHDARSTTEARTIAILERATWLFMRQPPCLWIGRFASGERASSIPALPHESERKARSEGCE